MAVLNVIDHHVDDARVCCERIPCADLLLRIEVEVSRADDIALVCRQKAHRTLSLGVFGAVRRRVCIIVHVEASVHEFEIALEVFMQINLIKAEAVQLCICAALFPEAHVFERAKEKHFALNIVAEYDIPSLSKLLVQN